MDISKRYRPISYLKTNTADVAKEVAEQAGPQSWSYWPASQGWEASFSSWQAWVFGTTEFFQALLYNRIIRYL